MLPGPDFPTGGVIINKNDIPDIMKTGHGSVKVRGRYKLEKNNIVFTEIPYGISTEDLIAELGNLVDVEKKIDGITHIRNESNKNGLPKILRISLYKISHEVILSILILTAEQITPIKPNQK